jgi:shikimate dehydrogenase
MKRACVIGWPVKHSRSPLIHGYWLRLYGIDGSYGVQPVEPSGAEAFVRGLPASGLAGCNVTLPHKQVAYAVAEIKDRSAVAVGAANTLWLEGGKIAAANTDTAGFMRHLETAHPQWRRRDGPVAVLGAGGAARAIVFGLLEAGVGQIRIFNRTTDRAEDLARHFGPRVRPCDWSDRGAGSTDCALVVNTTSLGMQNAGPLDIDLSRHNRECVVADIVYVPLETPLLRQARMLGMPTLDGLGMLLHQAVPGFEKWFGVRPEVTPELRATLVADIEGEKC